MKTKKYIGQTTHEAMLKLKMELGPDAIVLSTRTVRNRGIFGIFKKPLIEITAAFEEKDIINKKNNNNYDGKFNEINNELLEIKNMVMNFSLKEIENTNTPDKLVNIQNTMIKNGVSPNISSALIRDINEKVNVDEKDEETLEKIVRFNLSELLGKPEPITMGKDQKIIFFVGSTGVGKTTTIAKLAGNFVLQDRYKLGLITSDTYRIAAVEQLKIYSEILQLPLEIAYNKNDILNSIENFSEKDIILIDTAGRSHHDKEQLEEIKDILDSVDKKEVFLLIDATVDENVLSAIINKYNFLSDYKIIVTKIDEAQSFGNLLNIKYLTNKELSYFTSGQNVPDDIQVIDINYIVDKLIEENSND